MIDQLNEAGIEEVLQNQNIGRIGVRGNGKTYIIPIGYAYDDGCIYLLTREGMKTQMMRSNPNVCFQVDITSGMGNWDCVICWGEAVEINDPEERKKALRALTKKHLPVVSGITGSLNPNWPFSTRDESSIKGILVRIRLTEKTGRCEKQEERQTYSH